MSAPNWIALLLNQELAAVITAMRQNVKWALVPNRYLRAHEKDSGDDPLLEDFKLLRRRIFHWHDWSLVDPLEYLGPFLEVIRSPETSGPITGVALSSVCRMLDEYTLGGSGADIAEVMRLTAEAVTQCKFEATDPAADEVVLYKILQVLLACMKCPGGKLLTNDNVVSLFQACFRIGHYQTDRGKGMSELLTQASRMILGEMVALIFARLGEMPETALTPTTARSLVASRPLSPAPSAAPSATPMLAGPGALEPARSAEPGAAASGKGAAVPAENGGAAAGPPAEAAADGDMGSGSAAAPLTGPPEHLSPIRSRPAGSGGGGGGGHGLESVAEALGFVVSLVASAGEGAHADLNVLGLGLLTRALAAGGNAFSRHEALLALLREDAWAALAAAARTGGLPALAGACQAALALYCSLGSAVLLQVDAFLTMVVLPVAEGRTATGTAHQEAALEGLLDFCNQAGFVRAVFLNVDCRIERANLFETAAGLLSKTAFPVNRPLAAVHLLALEGLLAIMSSLSRGCAGQSGHDADESDVDIALLPVWEALCSGRLPPPMANGHLQDGDTGAGGYESPHSRAAARAESVLAAAADAALAEKAAKARLALAADHFNRDYKKGFQFLQALGLLAEELDAAAVARFLRFCPGLSKSIIGELLGENEDFFLEVLDAFTATFDFAGLSFDMAIRVYLESFRLPGEAQKINRIMESFGKAYHAQCPALFKNADAVYILAYSVILLNTDQHNSQVKKKMTVDEFVRNNRGINSGEDLPREFLRALYVSIAADEIRISSEAQAGSAPLSPVLWAQLALQSQAPRGAMLQPPAHGVPRVDREMFRRLWGPTVAAVSVVLDQSEEPSTVREALDGLLLTARIAAHHHVDEVMDSLVESLSRFTALLNPALPRAAVAFGENEKARAATQTFFAIANRYGDSLRSGWRNVLDCVIRLHRLGLLPPGVVLLEAGEPDAGKLALPRAPASRRTASATSIISRAFSSLISIESADGGAAQEAASDREAAAVQRTAACIAGCRLEDLFADSKFLRAEALLELVRAAMYAPGPLGRIAATGEGSDTAELCLELVIAVALRNRDRLLMVWPLVHEYLAAILSPEGPRGASALVARAALGLLRVCQRLLPYKEDTADALLRSLGLMLLVRQSTAWEISQRLATETLALVSGSAAYIRTLHGWSTVCKLISMTSMHPDAFAIALDALAVIARPPALAPPSFLPCLEAVVAVAERNASKEGGWEHTERALEMLDSMSVWVLRYGEAAAAGGPVAAEALPADPAPGLLTAGLPDVRAEPAETQATVPDMWMALVKALARTSTHPQEHIRAQALVTLQRTVVGSEALGLGGERWGGALDAAVVPLVAQLAGALTARSRTDPGIERTLRAAVLLLCKALLQFLLPLAAEPAFPALWAATLGALGECTKPRSEELAEAVPEALKNMLLVMAAQGVLTPAWTDADGRSLWDLTWSRARGISSGLQPQLLAVSGVAPAMPPPPYAAGDLGAAREDVTGIGLNQGRAHREHGEIASAAAFVAAGQQT
ncbi:hypothetical protein WJX81_000904 [Elliptochloris bilobata]|uniref:SEC7 domain-containing protein n=1 Tax=Elliptochloris bilobata TaxID=381761 RepID=A0AAW1S5T5_9CHLO